MCCYVILAEWGMVQIRSLNHHEPTGLTGVYSNVKMKMERINS